KSCVVNVGSKFAWPPPGSQSGTDQPNPPSRSAIVKRDAKSETVDSRAHSRFVLRIFDLAVSPSRSSHTSKAAAMRLTGCGRHDRTRLTVAHIDPAMETVETNYFGIKSKKRLDKVPASSYTGGL